MFGSPRIRQALAAISGLRVIVIVCEPVSRLDKLFWRFYQCRKDATPLPSGPDRKARCWHTAGAMLEVPELLSRWRMRDGIRSVLRLFGPRLLLLHQQFLRSSPLETYNTAAAFVGAMPWPPWASFQRYNWDRGHRTDLCRNASLLSLVKARLEPEYAALEELLVEAGTELLDAAQIRTTRCDRPEELASTPSSGPACRSAGGADCMDVVHYSEEGEDVARGPDALHSLRSQVVEGDAVLRAEVATLRRE
eukprot:CAMPEP_0175635444 /NCGR_PEP_ID=MMETSP0097-20121207/1694_1 /TAXON_ID=311494 /ORGANISM="Alexandrium monilatum, Strain CCMP3105" /LENGTH=249 /DNA_ID=CAMNT_0016941081 /DNA_START=1 /DNA_END=747 /DNA_ORIENTATION=-